MRPHAKYCCYRQTAGDPKPSRCNCGVKFNGKPFTYWQEMAERLVVECLVRASTGLDGEHVALPAQIAAQRLMMLARLEDSDLVKQVLQERDNFAENLSAMLGNTPKISSADDTHKLKRRFNARVKELGCHWNGEYVIAPVGTVFAGEGSHELSAHSDDGYASAEECYRDLLRRMEGGITTCAKKECDICKELNYGK